MTLIDKFKFQKDFEIDMKNFDVNRENIRKFNEVFSYLNIHQDGTAAAFFSYFINNIGYDHQRMLNQLSKFAEVALEKDEFKSTTVGRIRLLTKIYNYKKQEKKVFYVEQIV